MRSGEESGIGLKHFVGVVENRADPQKLGRVQVRIYGVHTEDKTAIPTEDLPWAMVVNPITSGSLSGIGRSPTGLVEGTWVFGIFTDEREYQVPFILGSLVGNPTEAPHKKKGFHDPNGLYPLQDKDIAGLEESSVSRLARGPDAETHSHIINKRAGKVNLDIVESAAASRTPSVLPDKSDSIYERTTWREPHPRFGGQAEGYPSDAVHSAYPFNHVWHTESGHVLEVDDTPGAERLHRFHKKGTFEEIQPDGSRVTKVVGNDYEITLGEKDVYIKGSVNVTIDGDARMLVHGDKIEEVDGDYMLTVRGDYVKKIGGNLAEEVMSDKAEQINGNFNQRISKAFNQITVGDFIQNLMAKFTKTTAGEEKRTNISSVTTILPDNYTLAGAGNMTIKAGNTLTISSDTEIKMHSGSNTTLTANGAQVMTADLTQEMTANTLNIHNNGNLEGTFTASTEVRAGEETKVTLTGHIHAHGDPAGNTGTGVG